MAPECLYEGLENPPNNWVLAAIILVDGAMFLKASLHGLKSGRVGAAPPPVQTTLSRVLIGPYGFCPCRMILEAILQSSKTTRGGWAGQPGLLGVAVPALFGYHGK